MPNKVRPTSIVQERWFSRSHNFCSSIETFLRNTSVNGEDGGWGPGGHSEAILNQNFRDYQHHQHHQDYQDPVPCESLDSREFSRIFLKFHFSILISSHFYFTFTSRSRFPIISISLSFLEKSERKKKFHPFFSTKKSEIWHQVSLNKLTIRGGCKTQNKVRQE